jgi:hypothetical protein
MMGELLNFPLVGGVSFSLILAVNVLVIRYIRAYQRETRDEYARRLTKAVIELESLKTENAKLEFEIERLLYLQNKEK